MRQRALRPGKAQPKKHDRTQDRRQADPARGRRAEGVRAGGLLHRHQGAGHAAWPHDPAGRRRRGAGQGRRELDQGHSGRAGGPREGLPRRRRRPGVGRDPGRRKAQGRVVEGRRRRSPTRTRSTTTSARRRSQARGREAERQRRRGVQDRRARDRGRIRMAVPVARRMGPACALVEIKDGKVTCGPARRSRISCRTASPPRSACRSADVHVHLAARPGLVRPQRCRRLRDGLRACSPRRSASRCACSTCAIKAPAGTRRARPRSTAPARRSTPRATSSPTSSSARDSRGSTSTPTAASRSTRWPASRSASRSSPATASACRRNPTSSPTSARRWETIPPLLDRSSPLRTSHLRDPVGPADPLRQRVVHRRGGGRARARTRSSSGCKHVKDPRDQRADQGRGAEVRLGHAAVAAQGPDRRQGDAAAASPTAQRNGTRVAIIAEVEVDRSTGKICAQEVHGRPRLRPDHQPGWAGEVHRGQHRAGHLSRTLWEEVKFDNKSVTSVDWMTYPILDITETPETIDFVLINHPELPPTGRRRAVDPSGRGGDRQRDLRRHRRAHPPRAVLAGPGEAGAVVSRQRPRQSERPGRNAGPFILPARCINATAVITGPARDAVT